MPVVDLLDPGRIPLVSDPAASPWHRDAFEADGVRVWGATARITRQFVDCLRDGTAVLPPDGPVVR
ncbi:hypothetical protein D3C86_2074040 [compost metagenome]